MHKCMDGLCSDPVLQWRTAESDSVVHDGETGFKSRQDKDIHRHTHGGKQRRYALLQCTASVHC